MQLQLIEESSLVMREAVKKEIVDVVLRPCEGLSIPLSMFSLVCSPEFAQPSANDPETFNLHTADQSLRWQENSLDWVTHDPVADYFMVEVARFSVPSGHVGYIEQLEQVVTDVDGNFFPTNQEYWGSPEFTFPDADNIQWFLKLDFFAGTQPPRIQLNNTAPIPASSIPGYPYNDLPIINELWYPAHCNRRIKLIVPGNRMLRLYAYSPPLVLYQWRYGGRLAGYTQSMYHAESTANARLITC